MLIGSSTSVQNIETFCNHQCISLFFKAPLFFLSFSNNLLMLFVPSLHLITLWPMCIWIYSCYLFCTIIFSIQQLQFGSLKLLLANSLWIHSLYHLFCALIFLIDQLHFLSLTLSAFYICALVHGFLFQFPLSIL